MHLVLFIVRTGDIGLLVPQSSVRCVNNTELGVREDFLGVVVVLIVRDGHSGLGCGGHCGLLAGELDRR